MSPDKRRQGCNDRPRPTGQQRAEQQGLSLDPGRGGEQRRKGRKTVKILVGSEGTGRHPWYFSR